MLALQDEARTDVFRNIIAICSLRYSRFRIALKRCRYSGYAVKFVRVPVPIGGDISMLNVSDNFPADGVSHRIYMACDARLREM